MFSTPLCTPLSTTIINRFDFANQKVFICFLAKLTLADQIIDVF